jgi:hypothetical protein
MSFCLQVATRVLEACCPMSQVSMHWFSVCMHIKCMHGMLLYVHALRLQQCTDSQSQVHRHLCGFMGPHGEPLLCVLSLSQLLLHPRPTPALFTDATACLPACLP